MCCHVCNGFFKIHYELWLQYGCNIIHDCYFMFLANIIIFFIIAVVLANGLDSAKKPQIDHNL